MPIFAKFVAIDLGAESGRTMLGTFDGERLALSELLRCPNVPVRVLDSLHWDVLRLFDDIQRGLALAAREPGAEIAALGLDTWGVDFALLDASGALLGNPYHYRDARTDGMLEEAFRVVPREQIFAQTGVQFMPLNTLYQLLAMQLRQPHVLAQAATLLLMPDLFNYWLTGRKVCEFTTATTTQFYDPRARAWAWPLLEALGLPPGIFPEVVPPGTVIGPLLPAVAAETGLSVPLIAPACHDTGSAVAAVPAAPGGSAWISSGTWSVLGAEVAAPVINATSLAYNFTNEGGARGFRLCRNVMGLWLVQECRHTWATAGEDLEYEQLVELARGAPAFGSMLDPDDDSFLHPGDMPGRIAAYCRRTAQAIPADKGAFVRCALEGLALKYRVQLERLETLLGALVNTVHIIGGGANNTLLCQFTANATGKRVVAGPVEATALGNVLMQALALGHIGSLAEGQELVRRSFAPAVYEPRDGAAWDEAYARFQNLLR